jgi:tetratricopeptide (TPR) repeat protein
MSLPLRHLPLVLVVALVATACGTAPPVQRWVGPAPEALVAEIRAAGKAAPDELDVQPLRDPMVEDLRVQAVAAERAQRHADAAAALDKALAISPDDPALLQERAEVAVLQQDLARAATLARRAFDIGAKVGPLCRRHWATIRQRIALDLGLLDAQAAAKPLKGEKLDAWTQAKARLALEATEAEQAQAACTLTGPPRY